jgi:hypothetical protein
VHVGGQLDELDELPVGRGSTDHQPRLGEALAVGVVHLVAVAVSLVHPRRAVEAAHQRPLREVGGVGTEPHRAAQVTLAGDDAALFLHRGDHVVGRLRGELGGVGAGDVGHVPRVLDHHALQAQAQPQGGDLVLPGVPDGSHLALDAPHPEPAGDTHRVDVAEGPRRARRLGAVVGGHPPDVDARVCGEPAGSEGLGDRQVGVVEVDVLAHQGHRDGVARVVHPAEQLVPAGPVDVTERQRQPPHHVGVETFGVQHLGDVVDGRCIDGGHDRLGVDVAHQRDLALDAVRDGSVGAADDRVGLDADLAQRRDRVLGGLGLQLTGRGQVGHERDVQEERPVTPDLVPHLSGRLEKRQRLDVADGAADLVDDDIGCPTVPVGRRHAQHAVLDRVRDVRDDLDGVAQVLAAALLGDHAGVDLPGGDVRVLAQVPVEEAFVVTDVEVGLGAVVGDEDLAVLERVHGAGVDVEVRVELLHRDAQATVGQQRAQARGGEPLAERGGDASGDEQVSRLAGGGYHGVPD